MAKKKVERNVEILSNLIGARAQEFLDRLLTHPGQGGPADQIAKMLREAQRSELFKLALAVSDANAATTKASVYKHVPQVGKKRTALMRFSIPSWKGHNEVFWKALCDYLVLALWSVTDLEYSAPRGTIRLLYFDTLTRRHKPPEFIASVVSRIAYLVENEILPTDFTRFRRMEERRGTIGGMDTEEAAFLVALLKII